MTPPETITAPPPFKGPFHRMPTRDVKSQRVVVDSSFVPYVTRPAYAYHDGNHTTIWVHGESTTKILANHRKPRYANA